jgi:hypothetical protein
MWAFRLSLLSFANRHFARIKLKLALPDCLISLVVITIVKYGTLRHRGFW